MKVKPILLITSLLLVLTASAQVNKSSLPREERFLLSLKSRTFIPSENIEQQKINVIARKSSRVNNKYFTVIQFNTIPSEKQKEELKKFGVELLEYVPDNAYTATITGEIAEVVLRRMNVRAIVDLEARDKMAESLLYGDYPSWAVKVAGTVDTWFSYPSTFSYEEVVKELKQRNIEIITEEWKSYHIIGIRTATSKIKEIAALPFVEYIQPAPKQDELLNNKSEANARANVLQSNLPGGRNLLGEGVVIGIGDDSNPLSHIDFTGRLINRSAIAGNFHGVHVMGTAAGAGIVNELYRGYAPKATIVSQAFSNILAYTPEYVQDYGMVITNNSYGNVVNDCRTFGVYDLYSRALDQQMNRFPNLQHVFAAGNSGSYNCSPYLPGYSNVLGAYQTAKNVISVANTSSLGILSASSSRGPVRDGRIKPEIAAQGSSVISTYPGNLYSSNSGTSMASPAVAGGLALLYQRYRQLNGDANPKNGLMKALLCNGATDLGPAGPDYGYGFGWMNLLRSVKMLEQGNYYNTTVNLNATNTHTITIPAGLAQLKVMLYWNDSAAAVFATQALVNDLDLEVSGPSGIFFPQKLDTVPSQVNALATTGPDHINNIEQVVINNPVAGSYTFSVKGTTIPFAGQHEYFLVYDTIPLSTTLTYPIGDERMVGAETINISWDVYGNSANDFTLQYSIDNGNNWIDINTAIPADQRIYSWIVPSVVTDEARIKLIHKGTGIESISEPFTIIGVPTVSFAAVQCEGYAAFNWTTVTGATDYEVMMLRGDEMISVATTTATSYTIGGLSKDSVYYFTVRARVNGHEGRRAIAIWRQPNTGTCAGTISDNDLKLDAIVSPASSGRMFTSKALSNNTSITIRIKNLDDAATSGDIAVYYKIGATPQVNETIIAPDIPAGATYDYTFTSPVDMSVAGIYDLKVGIQYTGDPVLANDTLRRIIKQIDNPVIDLTADLIDDFESVPEQTIMNNQIGLEGLDKYDFVTNTAYGRLRSFVNSGIANGSRAITLDADRYNAGGTTDSLIATFNLSNYDAATDDVRFDFHYKHHGQLPNAANKVWVRGDDQQPWILLYDLYANQEAHGVFKKSPGFELGDILAGASQNFSSSFQIKWGQWGQILTSDNDNAAGYTFDDIHLYTVTDDVQMLSIDDPVVASCGLTTNVPVSITLRNSANTAVNNVPVYYKIDNNSPVMEVIGTIAGNTSINFTFSVLTNDLNALGLHTIQVWSALPTDTYSANDTILLQLNNAPVISSFPYLQDFESGMGSWFAEGKNNSWEYGTPASVKINGAASGSKAWKTSLTGNYNDNELSYLYSPCFDISGMTNPTLSLSIALDIEDCGSSLCDASYIEYSADGINWSKLGTSGAGTNWYNKNFAGNHLWAIQNYTRWHVVTIPLPTEVNRLRLRIVMATDPYVSFEGIAVDDIHVYDNTMGIYTGSTMDNPVSQSVSGSGWIDFTSGGQLIASINPNGQNLGMTDVQAYVNAGPVRSDYKQYYHNRNITIKPTTASLADSATVRFYFLDTETEALINATGCVSCSKPVSAYRLGVSKFSHANLAIENGTIADNYGGNWLFVLPDDVIKVPFDKGYYAEFKVKDFSEFWLNNGGITNNISLPVELSRFSAKKKNSKDVLVEWATASENNVSHFEIEVSRSSGQYNQNKFEKIGEVKAEGNSAAEKQYNFIDAEQNKYGTHYYRLKTIDIDGRYAYSAVKAVVFDKEVKWQVYPNPSRGIFNLVYQDNAGEIVQVRVYNAAGLLVKQFNTIATGFVQKTIIDLQSEKTSGLYFAEVISGSNKQVFRLLKQ